MVKPELIAIGLLGTLLVSGVAAEASGISDVSPIPSIPDQMNDENNNQTDNNQDDDSFDFDPNIDDTVSESLSLNVGSRIDQVGHITPSNSTVVITGLNKDKNYTIVKYKDDGDPVRVTKENSGVLGAIEYSDQIERSDLITKDGYLRQIYQNQTLAHTYHVEPKMTLFAADSFNNGKLDQWEKTKVESGEISETGDSLYIQSRNIHPKKSISDLNRTISEDNSVTLELTRVKTEDVVAFRIGKTVGKSEYGKIGISSSGNYTIRHFDSENQIKVYNDGSEVGSVDVDAQLSNYTVGLYVEAGDGDDNLDDTSVVKVDEYGIVPDTSVQNWDGLTYTSPEKLDINSYDITEGTSPQIEFSVGDGYTQFVKDLPEANNISIEFTGNPADFEAVTMSEETETSSQKSILGSAMSIFS